MAEDDSVPCVGGRAKVDAIAHLAAHSLGIEPWQARVVAYAVLDILDPPHAPREATLVAAQRAVVDAGLHDSPRWQEIACVAAVAAVLELDRHERPRSAPEASEALSGDPE